VKRLTGWKHLGNRVASTAPATTALVFEAAVDAEASRVNFSKRRLGCVARHGDLRGGDFCDCQCTPEIVSTKKRGETAVAGHAASNNVGRGETH
jgi:hypothetical protein